MSQSISAQEIKQIRESYGLSQRSFAAVLGISEASIVRYEGGARPTRANANLIRAARNPQFMRECLERDGQSIPRTQRSRAEQYIYATVTLTEEGGKVETATKPVDPAQKMNQVYHYVLQQEVLNEQAANIIGTIIRGMINESFTGPELESMESLLDQVAMVKSTIIGPDSDDDAYLAQIRGYLKCAEDFLARRDLARAS